METIVTWKLKDGRIYDKLFPATKGSNVVIKKDADLGHTMRFIPQAVYATLSDTFAVSKQVLKGRSLYDTCRKVWYFIKQHIAYKPDENGVEQIRRPARLWWDRIGDCDCFTVFISSVLTNLGIPHRLRVTQYDPLRGFQHIYPIVPRPEGGYYTIDCVVNDFDYEEPFDLKKDHDMELHYLNGVPGQDRTPESNIDAEDLFGNRGDLGKLKILQKVKEGVKKIAVKVKEGVKTATTAVKEKGLHVINRVNPATVLLRTGVLASMKLNVFGVAEKLRWSYLSDAEATKRGIIPEKFTKLKTIREKLEKIFFDAGGKPENLKQAILTGKGNEDRKVVLSGLGRLSTNIHPGSPLSRILGPEIYASEISDNDSLGELGDPATATALAASTGAMGIIAGLLKAIGDIFRKLKSGGESEADAAESFDTGTDTGEETFTEDTTDYSETTDESGLTTTDNSGAREEDTGTWGKIKNWVSENKTTAIVVSAALLSAGGIYYLYTRKGKQLSGVPASRKRKRKGRKSGGSFRMKSLS